MRRILFITLVAVLVAPFVVFADDASKDAPKDTPNAAKTREKLKKNVKVEWKDTRFEEVIDDLKEQTGVAFHLDPNGVSKNSKVTLKSKDKSAEEVLNTIMNDKKWGWYIISKEKDAYDGDVKIRVSEERGYEQKGSK